MLEWFIHSVKVHNTYLWGSTTRICFSRSSMGSFLPLCFIIRTRFSYYYTVFINVFHLKKTQTFRVLSKVFLCLDWLPSKSFLPAKSSQGVLSPDFYCIRSGYPIFFSRLYLRIIHFIPSVKPLCDLFSKF